MHFWLHLWSDVWRCSRTQAGPWTKKTKKLVQTKTRTTSTAFPSKHGILTNQPSSMESVVKIHEDQICKTPAIWFAAIVFRPSNVPGATSNWHEGNEGEKKSLQEIIGSHPRKQKMPAWLSTLQCLADGPVLPWHTTVDKTEIGLLRDNRLAFRSAKIPQRSYHKLSYLSILKDTKTMV